MKIVLKALGVIAVLSLVDSQDFGEIFNNTGIIVNLLSDGKSSNDERDNYNLEEQKWYIGGKRVKGDSFKLQTSDGIKYEDPKDIIFEIRFPAQNEYYITHVSCLVEQSSSVGRAYIVDGGIGKNYMTLIIEGRRTTYLYYRVYLFGRNFS